MLTAEIIKRDEFYVKKGCHPKDCLLIVLEGAFRCSLSEKICEKNDIFVFNKNSHFTRDVLSPIKCILIQFDTFPVPLCDGLLTVSLPDRTADSIALLAEAVIQQNPRRIRHFVDDILLTSKCGQVTHSSASDPTVSACILYFRKNMNTAVTLDMLADKFFVSKQWLIAKFRRVTGKTPMEYLTEIRLGYAKNLLSDTDLPIGEIATSCGFENVYYFSNTFKKRLGISPSEYRKNFRL